MFNLYFKNPITALTAAFVLGMLAFIAVSVIRRQHIQKWGRLILAFVLAGTAISGLSATRDAFMMGNALFAPMSAQSIICAVAGGLIVLAGLVSLFVRNQRFRQIGFYSISALFIIQVVAIEASRIALACGGAL